MTLTTLKSVHNRNTGTQSAHRRKEMALCTARPQTNAVQHPLRFPGTTHRPDVYPRATGPGQANDLLRWKGSTLGRGHSNRRTGGVSNRPRQPLAWAGPRLSSLVLRRVRQCQAEVSNVAGAAAHVPGIRSGVGAGHLAEEQHRSARLLESRQVDPHEQKHTVQVLPNDVAFILFVALEVDRRLSCSQLLPEDGRRTPNWRCQRTDANQNHILIQIEGFPTFAASAVPLLE